MKTALLLLEIQNDYFPNGRMPLEKSNEIITNVQAVLQAFRFKKQPVIHVQHISTQPDASFLLPCTKGVEFFLSARPIQGEQLIKKHYPNSFKDTSLLAYLTKNQIQHLVVCGMMTHLTVDATVRAAYDLGFCCTVLRDACTTQALQFKNTLIPDGEVHAAFVAALQSMYANCVDTQTYLQAAHARPVLAEA